MSPGPPTSTAVHPEIVDVDVARPGTVRVVVQNPGAVDLTSFSISVSNEGVNADRFDSTTIQTLLSGQEVSADIPADDLLPPSLEPGIRTDHRLCVTVSGEHDGVRYDARRTVVVTMTADGRVEPVR